MVSRRTIQRRREFLARLLSWTAVTGLSGCGTMLHSERLNQPHSRDLDWKIVALNGLGLIFFFIPGVIAFVVDFHTGAIYLPPDGYSNKQPPEATSVADADLPPEADPAEAAGEPPVDDRVALRKVAVVSDDLTIAAIERELTGVVGTPVMLAEASSRTTPLSDLDDFQFAQQRHEADHASGLSPKQLVQRWRSRRQPQ